MKKILFLLTITAAFILSSCDKESLGVSKVTTYATMTLNGASTVFWQQGTAYTDPGCVALEGTNDISANIVLESGVDVTTMGVYIVNFSVENSDGFWAYKSRKVVVCDATAPLNGVYTSMLKRTVNASGVTANRGPFSVIVYGTGSDKYYIDDLIGGWYNFGNSYGTAYAGPGVVQVNPDNTVTLVSAATWTWGPCSIAAAGATVDPVSKKWLLNTTGVGLLAYTWLVTLTNPIK